MKIIREGENDIRYSRLMEPGYRVTFAKAIELIRQYEDAETVMTRCHCNTFDEDGNYSSFVVRSIKEIEALEDRPNPKLGLGADFADRAAGHYKFSLATDVGTDVIEYIVNKKKLAAGEKWM